ncbi:4'-phosphopantetheinyl transferase family protein [Nocardioides sp.]|uniref:4'-phosphopantetheinyl transferase family protein n=1 Tax=Nocardioides sp. TaxID=35761 RepID=UPI003D126B3E
MPDALARAAVDIAWHPASDSADQALRAQVAQLRGVPVDGVRVGRLCPRCGSEEHGRPWASGAQVSLSRSGPHLVTAASLEHQVGVDVESVAEISRRWVPAEVLHASERADTPEARASLWCRKEAILKVRGTGLVTPMPQIRTSQHQAVDLAAPHGYRAALAWSDLQHR